MGDLDTLVDQVAADVGATDVATPGPEPSSAEPGGAPAGADRADTETPAKDAKSETELIVDRFLEAHPAKEGNEFDPVTPKTAPSDGAEKPDAPGTTTDPDPTLDAKPDEAGKPADADSEDAKPADWLTKDEMAALGPKAKARIENLWRENREHRSFVTRADPFLAPIRDNNLPLADVQIMAQLAGAVNRQDWKTFYDAAKPYFDIAEQALGLSLPEDLKRRVDDGEMTQEAASELSRTRHVAAGAQAREKQVSEQVARDREAATQRDASAATANVSKAVNDWEGQERTRNPDYPRLRPLILDKMVAFAAQHGPPPDPQAAVRLAEWAKGEVLKALPGGPPARATPKQPTANGSAKAPLRAEPKNVYDAVFQRLGIS
jgi:hypothetical protein